MKYFPCLPRGQINAFKIFQLNRERKFEPDWRRPVSPPWRFAAVRPDGSCIALQDARPPWEARSARLPTPWTCPASRRTRTAVSPAPSASSWPPWVSPVQRWRTYSAVLSTSPSLTAAQRLPVPPMTPWLTRRSLRKKHHPSYRRLQRPQRLRQTERTFVQSVSSTTLSSTSVTMLTSVQRSPCTLAPPQTRFVTTLSVPTFVSPRSLVVGRRTALLATTSSSSLALISTNV